MNDNNPIGVFDSGLGGITVLKELYSLMPHENYIFFGDSKNAPYGTKTEEEVRTYSFQITDMLLQRKVKAIVIACNTATSVCAEDLRKCYSLPIIGIEPAVKPAAIEHPDTKVLVMATPITLSKEKFMRLMENYRNKADIIPLPCPGLVEIIEQGKTDTAEIEDYLKVLFSPYEEEKIGAVVLGCTHYPFIRKAIQKHFPYPLDIIDGGKGTARETKRKLLEAGHLNESTLQGKIEFISSLDTPQEIALLKKMFFLPI